MSDSQGERVLIIKLGALGDILLADGALRDIRLHHPNARIDIMVRAPYAALMRACPWVDEVMVDDNAPRWQLRAMQEWRRRLLAGGYGDVYDLQNSRRTTFYRRWLDNGLHHWCYTPRHQWKHSPLPVPQRLARQLRAAGVGVKHARTPHPYWIAGDCQTLLQTLTINTAFIILLPGSSMRHEHKRWPHFAELSHRLSAQGVQVLTIPGPDENDIGAGYAGHILRRDGNPLDLHEVAGLMLRASCVVGNDSGPTHLATCLRTPCVTLFDRGNRAQRATMIDGTTSTGLTGAPLRSLCPRTVAAAVLAHINASPFAQAGADSPPDCTSRAKRLPAYNAANIKVRPPQNVE